MNDEDFDSDREPGPESDGPMQSITVEVPVNMAERVAAEVVAHFKSNMQEQIRREIVRIVDAEATKIAQDQIAPIVAEVLRDGWVKTDEYGVARSQERVTLQSRISDMLSRKDQYSSNQRWWEKLIVERVDLLFREEMSGEIDAAKKKIREMLDARVVAAFGEIVRTTFGVK